MGKRKAPPASDDVETQQHPDNTQKAAKQPKLSAEAVAFKNKEKVLLLSSRGITHRQVCLSGHTLKYTNFSALQGDNHTLTVGHGI